MHIYIYEWTIARLFNVSKSKNQQKATDKLTNSVFIIALRTVVVTEIMHLHFIFSVMNLNLVF